MSNFTGECGRHCLTNEGKDCHCPGCHIAAHLIAAGQHEAWELPTGVVLTDSGFAMNMGRW